MQTSYGFGVTARISLQLPMDEAKSVPILQSTPPHTHPPPPTKQTTQQKVKTGQRLLTMEASMKKITILYFLAMGAGWVLFRKEKLKKI